MLRVLVFIAALVFFREVLPRRSRSSAGSIRPYRSALDGIISPEQLGLELNELFPYESLAGQQGSLEHAQIRSHLPAEAK